MYNADRKFTFYYIPNLVVVYTCRCIVIRLISLIMIYLPCEVRSRRKPSRPEIFHIDSWYSCPCTAVMQAVVELPSRRVSLSVTLLYLCSSQFTARLANYNIGEKNRTNAIKNVTTRYPDWLADHHSNAWASCVKGRYVLFIST